MNYYKGKVVWVTGASSGIGREMALQLGSMGALLILTARHLQALEAVQAIVKDTAAACRLLPCDLSDASQREDLCQRALAFFSRVDILINNAGISQRAMAASSNNAAERQLMELDFFAPVGLTKGLLPHFLSRNQGHIIYTGSMAGLMGFPQRSSYCAAKHALKGYAETLQLELAHTGICIMLASPGRINTPISLSAITANGQPHNKMDEGQAHGIPAASCAQKILSAAAAGKSHVFVAGKERILYWLWWWWPAMYRRLAINAGKMEQ